MRQELWMKIFAKGGEDDDEPEDDEPEDDGDGEEGW